MAAESFDTTKLPSWLREVIENSEPTDFRPGLRGETRRNWAGSCFAQLDGASCGGWFPVRGFNVAPTGLGFISRCNLQLFQELTLFPREGPGQPVRVRVVHSTQTVQGYKIGCTIEQE